MAVKKSELYNKLWESCNTLRSKGGMDATQYKDYVLIVLFMKVITQKKDSLIKVPKNANFDTMITLKGKKNIGERFNEILAEIAKKNELQNVIDVVDFNDENKLGKGKDLIDALSSLVEIFQDPQLDFSNNKADDDDILGDAYEYLMKKFATEAGKSKGQFYTPSEVSRVMAKIIGINKAKKSPIYVYDMTCGSGSLLLKAAAEAKEDVTVELYGQEKDINTAGLAVMNMFLHGNAEAQIKDGNTLTNPKFLENGRLRTFNYCVANPPFSIKRWSSGMGNSYGRFSFGMPPESCGDYAFLLHMLTSMDPDNGRGAIILPHGVLFRGGQEEIIRKNLVENGYIEGIIGLPTNLFYGTGIPACIIILDKKDALKREHIFMIDASNYFMKDGNKNKLREQDIRKIIDTYLNTIEEEKYSKKVLISNIRKQKYNLNIPRYIDCSKEEKIEDLKSHLTGGIPERDINKYHKYWKLAPTLKEELFQYNKKQKNYDLKVPSNKITELITNSEEMGAYEIKLNEKIKKWKLNNEPILKKVNEATRTKDLIDSISVNLLELFEDSQLIDKYEAYEYLLVYYNETMRDDLYLIKDNGWIPTLEYAENKNGQIRKNEFDSDLLPKQIVIHKYFKKENDALTHQINELNDITLELNSMIQENTGEGLLFNEEDKVDEKYLKELLKEASNEEITIINELLEHLKTQKEDKKLIKKLQQELNAKLITTYENLDEETSKELIIKEKWFKAIESKFKEQNENLLYELSNNIVEDVLNYETTLSELVEKTSKLEKKVLEDLKRMKNDGK